jgi:hypothetical protein
MMNNGGLTGSSLPSSLNGGLVASSATGSSAMLPSTLSFMHGPESHNETAYGCGFGPLELANPKHAEGT